MTSYKFQKSERLTNKDKFEVLFEKGNVIKAFPLKLIYLTRPVIQNDAPIQMAFSVPKRNFKKAVDRNFIKRRLKEAYRLNKHRILPKLPEDQELFGIIIHVDRKLNDFQTVEKSMKYTIRKLIKAVLTENK